MNANEDLAAWFWTTILEREESPHTHPAFNRYRAEAKRAIKTLNVEAEVLKEALLQMKAAGKYEVKSLLLPTLVAPRIDKDCWYEVVKSELETAPPVYERHNFKKWCIRTGNEHLLAELT